MKKILHSISYCGLWGQAALSLEEFIIHAAKLGYDGIEITAKRPHASPLDMDKARCEKLCDLMGEHRIEPTILAAYNDFCGGHDAPGMPFDEIQILAIVELCKMARELGCDKLRVFTGFERLGVTFDSQWRACKLALKECAKRASEFGVTLCVQNHHDIAVHYESLFDLLSEVDEPNCKAGFDAWAPALHGDDLAVAIRRMAPFIAHTTVADYVQRPRFCYAPELVNYRREVDALRAVPMGEGFIDYKSFFHALRDVEYSGAVAYEMCSPLRGGGSMENLDACAREFLRWMKEF